MHRIATRAISLSIAICVATLMLFDAANAQAPRASKRTKQQRVNPQRTNQQRTKQQRVNPQRANRKAAPSKQAARKSSTAKTARKTTTPNNQVVAVVNGETVSRNELAKACLSRYGKSVLESVVNKFLIQQECKRKGVQISKADIDKEISTIASKFNLSVDRWLQLLKTERHISPEQYRRDIIWPTLALRQLVSEKISVSPDEINREFESEYGPKVQARMIATDSRKAAEEVLAAVKAKPNDFGKIAKNKSVDTNSAAARGFIPPIRKHVGDKNIEKVAFSLKPGQISPIIPFANQFIILKCEKQLPANQISSQYEQVARERLKDRLLDRNLRTAATELSQRLQAEAKVTNVFNNREAAKKMPGVAALINGQRISTRYLAEESMARHGVDVLETLVNRRMLKQALKRTGASVAKKELDQEVARAAETMGHLTKDGKADVDAWLKSLEEQEGMSVRTYVDDAVWPSVALKKLVANQVKISKDDLAKGFQANYGPGIEVLAIVLGSQRIANEVWDMARAKRDKTFFGQLASQYSIEPVSRANLGEVPPIRKHSGQPTVEKEAFQLTPKDPLSGIVAVGDRYIIMYYLGKTKPVVDSMTPDVKSELTREIREKKLRLAMAQEFDRLKNTSQIDNFLTNTTHSAVAKDGRPARTSPRIAAPVNRGNTKRR